MARVSGATKNPDEINPVSQSLSQSKRKAQKGTVVVQVFKDRLRLCWSYLGKRFFLDLDEFDEVIEKIPSSKPSSDLLSFNCLLSQQQRERLFQAINQAKSKHGLETTAEALDAIPKGQASGAGIAQDYLNA